MPSFFQTLLRPDREDPESRERGEVAEAANILMVGEFQLLQLAYFDWFGEDMPTDVVDRLFGAYMVRNQVPHWARHFARRILERDAKGFVNPHNPFYHRYDANYVTYVPNGFKRFCKASAFLILFIAGAIWLASLAVKSGGPFQFPPYVDTSPADASQDSRINP